MKSKQADVQLISEQLFNAVEKNDLEKVSKLLSNGDIDISTLSKKTKSSIFYFGKYSDGGLYFNKSVLHDAVKNNNEEMVKLLLTKGAKVNESCYCNGYVTGYMKWKMYQDDSNLYDDRLITTTLLTHAKENDNKTIIAMLLNAEADSLSNKGVENIGEINDVFEI